MNKITIVGANSYIARNLIHYIRTNIRNTELALYDIAEQHIDGQKPYQQINVLDGNEMKKIDFSCDAVFVFTGKTGSLDSFEHYDDFIHINEISLLNIIQEYRKQESKAKIIFPSTRLVYRGKEMALKENEEKEFLTVYAINKYACEQYLKMYHSLYNIDYCILRICVPYGTMIQEAVSYGTAEFMLSKAKNGQDIVLYGNGSQRRTITFIGDLIRILYWAAGSEQCMNDIYNIGGEDYSLYEMAEKIAIAYGVRVKFQEWPKEAKIIESGSTVFDSSKLDDIMGDQARIFDGKFSKWIGEQ